LFFTILFLFVITFIFRRGLFILFLCILIVRFTIIFLRIFYIVCICIGVLIDCKANIYPFRDDAITLIFHFINHVINRHVFSVFLWLINEEKGDNDDDSCSKQSIGK